MSIAWKPFKSQVALHIKKTKANKLPPPPPQARKQFAEKVVSLKLEKIILV